MIPWRKRISREHYARFVIKHPAWVMTVVLSITAVALLISVEWLKIDRSSLSLYTPDTIEMQEYRSYMEEFGEPDDLIIVVEGATSQKRREFIDMLAQHLEQEPMGRVSQVLFQIPIRSFVTLLMASDEDLAGLEKSLENRQALLAQLLAAPNLESLFNQLATTMQQELDAGKAEEDPAAFFASSEALFAALQATLESEQPDAGLLLMKWGRAVSGRFAELDNEGYLVAEDGALHMRFVKPGGG